MQRPPAMKTLLVRGSLEPPPELRRIVESGSTEVAEVAQSQDAAGADADRLVKWNGREVVVDSRRLKWPEDEDEIRMLFQTGG
jgi:hypothetical protein